MKGLSLQKPYSSIVQDLRKIIRCPKWRAIFENNLVKGSHGYEWRFEHNAVFHNLTANNHQNSLTNWTTAIGMYPGRSLFAFPEYSRYVHLNTNTLPMMNVCPQLHGFGDDIFAIQGDENPQNHWVYELEDEINPYASKMANFMRHYDGVHVLLKNRE